MTDRIVRIPLPHDNALMQRPRLLASFALKEKPLVACTQQGFGKTSLGILLAREFDTTLWLRVVEPVEDPSECVQAIEDALVETIKRLANTDPRLPGNRRPRKDEKSDFQDLSTVLVVLDGFRQTKSSWSSVKDSIAALIRGLEPKLRSGLSLYVTVDSSLGLSEPTVEGATLLTERNFMLSNAEAEKWAVRYAKTRSGQEAGSSRNVSVSEVIQASARVPALLRDALEEESPFSGTEAHRMKMITEWAEKQVLTKDLRRMMSILVLVGKGSLGLLGEAGIRMDRSKFKVLASACPLLGCDIKRLEFSLPAIRQDEYDALHRVFWDLSPSTLKLIADMQANRNQFSKSVSTAMRLPDAPYKQSWLDSWGERLLLEGESSLVASVLDSMTKEKVAQDANCMMLQAYVMRNEGASPVRLEPLARAAWRMLEEEDQKACMEAMIVECHLRRGMFEELHQGFYALRSRMAQAGLNDVLLIKPDLVCTLECVARYLGNRSLAEEYQYMLDLSDASEGLMPFEDNPSSLLRACDPDILDREGIPLGERAAEVLESITRAFRGARGIDDFGGRYERSTQELIDLARTFELAGDLLLSHLLLFYAAMTMRASGDLKRCLILLRRVESFFTTPHPSVVLHAVRVEIAATLLLSGDEKQAGAVLRSLRNEDMSDSVLERSEWLASLLEGSEEEIEAIRECMRDKTSSPRWFVAAYEAAFFQLQSRVDTQEAEEETDERGQSEARAKALISSKTLLDFDYKMAMQSVGFEPDWSGLFVHLFGGLRLERNEEVGKEDVWTKRKAKALFTALVLEEGRDMARDVLFEQLWPDMDWPHAKSNCYVTWASMRKTLARFGDPGDYVENTRGLYRVNTDAVCSDVQVFDLLLARIAMLDKERDGEEILALYQTMKYLYRGPLLAGDPYNDHFAMKRQKYHDSFMQGMVSAANLALFLDNEHLALWFAGLALESDPSREEAYQVLMKAQVKAHQRGSALDTYHRCRSLLRDELGIDPSEETMKIYNDLLMM